MGRLIYIYIIIAFLCRSSCSAPGQKLTTDKLKNAYQIFPYKQGIICLMIYDEWGENNAIIQYNKELNIVDKNNFSVDPIPRIISKNEDTITIRYIFTKDSMAHRAAVIHNGNYLSSLGYF